MDVKTARTILGQGLRKASSDTCFLRSTSLTITSVHERNRGHTGKIKCTALRKLHHQSRIGEAAGQTTKREGKNVSSQAVVEAVAKVVNPLLADYVQVYRDSQIGRASSDGDIYRKYDELLSAPKAKWESVPFVQQKRDLGQEVESPIDLFLENGDEVTKSLYGSQKIREQCRPKFLAELQTVESQLKEPEQAMRRAWLDDRSTSHEAKLQRQYYNPLAASQLYHILKVPRGGEPFLLDAERRLMLVARSSRSAL